MSQLQIATDWQRCLDRVRATFPARSIQASGHRWELIDTRVGRSTVVVLPGGLARADAAFRWIDRLCARYRVITLAYPHTITTIDELIASFRALCDELRIEIGLLSGGSYSGLIAQCLARSAPDRVGALVLSDTGVPLPARARRQKLLLPLLSALPIGAVRAAFRRGVRSFVRPMEREQRHFWQTYFDANIAAMPRAAYLSLLHVWLDIDRSCRFRPNDLAAWRGRTLIIEAERDRTFGAAERAALRALYPAAATHVFTGYTHSASLELIDRYIDVTLRWWEQT